MRIKADLIHFLFPFFVFLFLIDLAKRQIKKKMNKCERKIPKNIFTKVHPFLDRCCARSSVLSRKSENQLKYLLSNLKIERTNNTNLKMNELYLNKKSRQKMATFFFTVISWRWSKVDSGLGVTFERSYACNVESLLQQFSWR